MQNAPDLLVAALEDRECAFFRKRADPDQPFRVQDVDDPTQMSIACCIEGFSLSGREFVGVRLRPLSSMKTSGQ